MRHLGTRRLDHTGEMAVDVEVSGTAIHLITISTGEETILVRERIKMSTMPGLVYLLQVQGADNWKVISDSSVLCGSLIRRIDMWY